MVWRVCSQGPPLPLSRWTKQHAERQAVQQSAPLGSQLSCRTFPNLWNFFFSPVLNSQAWECAAVGRMTAVPSTLDSDCTSTKEFAAAEIVAVQDSSTWGLEPATNLNSPQPRHPDGVTVCERVTLAQFKGRPLVTGLTMSLMGN